MGSNEPQTIEHDEKGAMSLTAKVASFVVLPIAAIGSIIVGSDDPPRPVLRSEISPVRGDERSGERSATSRTREVAVRHPAVIKTPWQEALEAGGGVVGRQEVRGVPEVARRAYDAAAARLAVEVPTCHVDWALLAAIGQVETDHGRYGGSDLRPDGTTTLAIRGVPLDGRDGVALITDSDGGALDGDTTYDRAVGPMQFIPGTWRAMARDGNGDGLSAPDNVFDAALAAADYLCATPGDLRTRESAAPAVRRYNQSDAYVATVLTIRDRLAAAES